MRVSVNKHLLHWLLVATLVLQVLVPVGFMPDLNALQTGHLRLTICSGHMTKDVVVNVGTNPSAPEKSKQTSADNQSCPFAFAHMQATATPFAALLSITLLLLAFIILPLANCPFFERVKADGPRGPPLLLN